jgi:hypothetical protein
MNIRGNFQCLKADDRQSRKSVFCEKRQIEFCTFIKNIGLMGLSRLILVILVGVFGLFFNQTVSAQDDVRLIPCRKGDKFGYCDINKKIVIEPKYDFSAVFIDGLARVNQTGLVGIIDKTGKEIVPPKYLTIYPFIEGLALVRGDTSCAT